jgi:3-oxoadipate enol-lactonase
MAANLALTGNLDDGRDAALAAAARHVERARTAHRSRAGERVQRASLVYHEVSGSNDGPTIVLGNSLGSTIEMWDGVVEELGTRYRIVRYDLRGHGRSPTPPGPYAIGELGADVIALLDELGVERANLVGSSIGGMAAMRVAAHAPERVDKLILIGTSAHLGPARSWIDRARTVLAAGTRAVSETVVGRWVTEDYAAGHPDAMARYGAMFDATDPTAYAGCCLAIAAMDQTWDLPRIGAPTLVIVGSDDRATPREHAEAIAERVPDARVATIEGTAHLPSLERPEEVVRLVKEHLA